MTTKRPRKPASTGTTRVPQKVSPAKGAGLSVPAPRETLVPLSSRAIFWPPRYLAASSNLIHLPFLFWLVETIRPTSVVQLGLGDGVGFMALCQAIDKLGLETICMGVDLDTEDQSAAPENPPEKMIEAHGALYSDFSFIVRDKAGQAARHMRQTRLDMLVIDCPVDDTLLSSLQAHWQPLLSDRAVLVLQQPQRNLSDPAAQRFLDDLTGAHPTIRFPQSETGLDVILTGANQPERLSQLAQLDLGTPGYLTARQVFTRLGQGVEHAQQTRSKSGMLDKTKAALKVAQAEIEKLQEAREKLARDLYSTQKSEEAQVTANASLQSRIFDLSQELDLVRANTASNATLEKSQTELQAALARLADMEAALSESEQQRHALVMKTESMDAEKTALEARLAEVETKAQTARENAAKTHAQALAEVNDKLAQAERKGRELGKKVDSLSADKTTLEARLAEVETKANAARENAAKAHAQALAEANDKLAQAERKGRELGKKVDSLSADKTTLEARLAEVEAEAQAARENAAKAHAQALAEVNDKLVQAERKGRELARTTDRMDAEKTALEARLAEAEAAAQALTVQNATIQAGLEQSQEKRLALWEAHETLKLQHDVLLRQYGERAAPATPGDADDR